MKPKAIDATMAVYGRITKTMCPSGRVFEIREQNGEDDGILSNFANKDTMTHFDNFLYAIILHEWVGEKKKAVTMDEISVMLMNDRTHLMVASRVHTLGPIMKFEFQWPDLPKPTPYVEDLSLYLHDYSKPFPEVGDKDYFKYKIPVYPANAYGIFPMALESGKLLRFKLLSRVGEKYLLTLPYAEQTNNSGIMARELEFQTESGEWVKVENFRMFSKKDMIEINRTIVAIDSNYQFISEIEHPTTKEIHYHHIFTGNDFFFPAEA